MVLQRFLILVLTIVSLFAGGAVLVAGYVCSTTDNFTAGSQYQVNLNTLIGNLLPSTIAGGGFADNTVGNASDKVFGLAMCYADRDLTQCQGCLRNITRDMQQVCQFSREVKVCYDACVLHYSDQPFLSDGDLDIAFYVWLTNSWVADMASMNATRWSLMTGLVPAAASSPLRFANGTKMYTDSQGNTQVMYGLAQCTRDLDAGQCVRCLNKFVPELSRSRPNDTYGTVKGYSCYVAYRVGVDLGITILPMAAPPLQPPDPSPAPGTPSPSSAALVAGVTVGCVVIVICIGILFVYLLRRRRGTARKEEEEPLEDGFERRVGPRRFHYNELAMATNFFSEEEKLGQGGFGLVYHGYLKDMDLHVAVKRVSKTSEQGRKEYISEVKIISQLRHRNLVQLIGWCHDGGELLLVYQLMPNGSLDAHIHNQNVVMSWQQRYDVVLGIGSALLYLHQDSEQCVLHRDIKPSNIMLDASFTAKLGDFGLARLINHSRQSHTTVLAGTMGYIDPECMLGGKASTSSDVYSFGVVLLEMACGRQPIVVVSDTEEYATIHLVYWVWEFYGRGRILDAADARLNGGFNPKEMESVLVTALWCAHPDRNRRPSIRQAINVLRHDAAMPSLPAKAPVSRFLSPATHLRSERRSVTGRSSRGIAGTARSGVAS
ncbi:hypothetical protein EJB05_01775 [Eragrostis curvula]|uniref:Protein kinase domain-containing protein n=1 Tax=Eragrostis curvula TaxID=38414 RepID=A0A5J9WRA6_9POAL|nr:hypothetical protein EJB05_01775 [Eragrostis curvula]